MKIIKWSSEKLGSHEILLDDEDFEKFGGYNWTVEKATTGGLYAKRKYTYALNKRKAIALHRVILGITDVSIFVDHIDGNGLNNQKSNLRIATYTQNKQNIKIQKNNKSGFKGVLIRGTFYNDGTMYTHEVKTGHIVEQIRTFIRK